ERCDQITGGFVIDVRCEVGFETTDRPHDLSSGQLASKELQLPRVLELKPMKRREWTGRAKLSAKRMRLCRIRLRDVPFRDDAGIEVGDQKRSSLDSRMISLGGLPGGGPSGKSSFIRASK